MRKKPARRETATRQRTTETAISVGDLAEWCEELEREWGTTREEMFAGKVGRLPSPAEDDEASGDGGGGERVG